MEKRALSKEQVKANWDKRSMYIVWGDGTDSICQENGYTMEDIFSAMDSGCEVFFD